MFAGEQIDIFNKERLLFHIGKTNTGNYFYIHPQFSYLPSFAIFGYFGTFSLSNISLKDGGDVYTNFIGVDRVNPEFCSICLKIGKI